MTDLTSARWRKSSFSSSNGGQCVEVASNLPAIIVVRDSKNPDGGALVVTAAQWRDFLAGARSGEFDL